MKRLVESYARLHDLTLEEALKKYFEKLKMSLIWLLVKRCMMSILKMARRVILFLNFGMNLIYELQNRDDSTF